jgi:hypothetical protein
VADVAAASAAAGCGGDRMLHMLILMLVVCVFIQQQHQPAPACRQQKALAATPSAKDEEWEHQQWEVQWQDLLADVPAAHATRSDQAAAQPQQQSFRQYEQVVPDMQKQTGVIFPDVAQQVVQHELAGKGRKIIAVSLFGNSSKYTKGALENAVLARRDWPGWVYRVYYGSGVPADVLSLIELLGAELVDVSDRDMAQGRVSSTMWRFVALLDRTATRTIFRDADARLTRRDKAAVGEWVQSKHPFHTMHDHPAHKWPVLAGMFGVVNGLLHPHMIQELIAPNKLAGEAPRLKWFADQQWLKDKVWPHVKQHTMAHAAWHCHRYGAATVRGFPTERQSATDFVGNRYEEENDWQGETVTKSGNFTCPTECRRHPSWEQC